MALATGVCATDTNDIISQKSKAIIYVAEFVDEKWVNVNPQTNESTILNEVTEAGAFFARRNRDPARVARLREARRKLGNVLEANYDRSIGLVAFRMKAGLSQTALAKIMDTQQPSIARWERSPEGMSFTNMQALAKVFGVEATDICAAIQAQSATKNKRVENETT